MSVATRQLHRKNLRRASEKSDDGGLTAQNHLIAPQAFNRSSAVLEALSDENSKLGRFLFLGGGDSFQEDGDDDIMPSMNELEAKCYALALEPMEIRNERIIQLFEAYAIFGALFMAAIYTLYEYGSHKAYGGDGTNYVAQRIFEFIMALALSSNMLLALFGGWYWIYAIAMNSSHEDFVIQSIKPLMYLYYLLCFTGNLVWVGMLLGIYCNLSPYVPETIVGIIVAFAICLSGSTISASHMLAVSPLELYHLPTFVRNNFLRKPWLEKKSKDDLKLRSKIRAQELRKRAYIERKRLDPEFETERFNNISMENLLLTAARKCGRKSDISDYESRLKEDWLTKPKQLEGLGLEYLSRYMPLGLAKEVQQLVDI
mmetsp:Transcript_19924/g.30780  ORF Transcript_19924/g.30780 Transcript_19924/m.30780 type:complete len:372 (-) Transcript_19924:264-1379(-)|eukprot:CAMPEP_0195283308 /NCGR_PEP_ID=MMETSP0707-20130614/1894_1 /TAXON_ID=33640 /ORGANISM="Asterionellopsis glacialis, Strain CCMP134" /LENGTH=371 /DNA_ID=CAMNT_0040342451 /DNA_START=43 /DNA_END=1158 /DNA_ORIENTATION=+